MFGRAPAARVLAVSAACVHVLAARQRTSPLSCQLQLSKYLSIEVMVTTGGTSLKDDIMRLYQTTHIVVATPGRVVDLASKGVARLNECRMLVMDEVSVTWLRRCLR